MLCLQSDSKQYEQCGILDRAQQTVVLLSVINAHQVKDCLFIIHFQTMKLMSNGDTDISFDMKILYMFFLYIYILVNEAAKM